MCCLKSFAFISLLSAVVETDDTSSVGVMNSDYWFLGCFEIAKLSSLTESRIALVLSPFSSASNKSKSFDYAIRKAWSLIKLLAPSFISASAIVYLSLA